MSSPLRFRLPTPHPLPSSPSPGPSPYPGPSLHPSPSPHLHRSARPETHHRTVRTRFCRTPVVRAGAELGVPRTTVAPSKPGSTGISGQRWRHQGQGDRGERSWASL
ncbi:hypothetical protein B7C62_19330 [Kitasatospora albolonga]|uniref:Uncharacterized protein n=1 Tax=Kitasatospora albolonga TaxID=68173 RepID=A0ABC8BV75_9ACTN|nr:hypothetical protein B7C62_19330 [Kitasatospora albolonga]